MYTKRKLLAGMLAGTTIAAGAGAQSQRSPVRIGVLTDLSGPLSNSNGKGSVIGAQLAAEDFGGTVDGRKIEVISADHQNKPDVAASIARQWFENEQVSVIVDVPNSSVAFAVHSIARDRNKVFLASGPSSSEFTGKACSPNTIHWQCDTWMFANVIGKSALKAGLDTFFFITADYSFGQILARDLTTVITGNGGRVLGNARHPLNTADFSSHLLQASASGAKAVALLNTSADTTNAIKQAFEYRLMEKGQKLVSLLLSTTEVQAIGLPVAQGLVYAEAFYWDHNERTRKWSERFERVLKGVKPNNQHAGAYSASLHYLKAIATGQDPAGGSAVVAKMKEMPTDDAVYGPGKIRIDGRKIHPILVQQVKAPSQSRESWDLATAIAVVPGEEAFRPPIAECPLVG